MLFEGGIAIDKYKGERTLNALVDYVTENTPPSATESEDVKKEKGKVSEIAYTSIIYRLSED